jgi:hypothetical protein
MTGSSNIEGRIAQWMEEREVGTHFPDRLLSATFEKTRERRQARSLRWRTFPMLRSLTSLAAAGAAAVVLAAVGLVGLNLVANQPSPTGSPAPDATVAPSAAPQESEQVALPFEPRRGGEILMFRGAPDSGWDLAAQDPETGKVRKIVETNGILDCAESGRCVNFVKTAMWSPDGRWVAFEISFGSLDGGLPHGPCGPTAGLWVQGTIGGPRQLTTPCEATPGADDIKEMWEWSPDSARLAFARIDGDDDRLFLIDPSDGRRTLLVEGGGDYSGGCQRGACRGDSKGLAWSPDGTRLVYAVGGSVYVVRAQAGEQSRLAEALDDVLEVQYSPDGTQIMVRDYDYSQARDRIQVMNADGSDLHVVLEGDTVFDEAAWSPNGDRIVYQLSIANGSDSWDSEVWTVAPDGTNRIKVFDSDGCNMSAGGGDGLPVWANGTQIAYNACGRWVVSNADGTGEPQMINERVHRSLAGGGLSGWDIPGIN